MRSAILITAAVLVLPNVSVAGPVRLECEREILGDRVTLYVDTERKTLRVESDFFGLKDKKDLQIDMLTKKVITARSGRPGYRIGHVIDRQSGVYKEIHVTNDSETENVFVCKRGEPVL